MLPRGQDLVDSLQPIRECRKKLHDAEQRLYDAKLMFDAVSEPLLKDYSLIPYLYRLFCDIVGVSMVKGEEREMFVFIVLYLYAPGKMDETQLPDGLRLSLANVLHLNARSVISRIKGSSVLHYEIYFHDEVDDIFSVMVNRLLDDGYLQKND